MYDVTKPGEHLFREDWGKAVKYARQDAQVAKMFENKDNIYVGRWHWYKVGNIDA